MTQEAVFLLHGFASSGNSRKASFFGEKFGQDTTIDFEAVDFNPTPRDFEFMTITGMINRLRQVILDRERRLVSLIGSSLGALVGLHYARRYGGVRRLYLLAPALTYGDMLTAEELARWEKRGTIDVQHFAFDREIPLRFDYHQDGISYAEHIPPPAPVKIIHGIHDDVIPVARSRAYANLFPKDVVIVQVDSDHRLNDVLDLIWRNWRTFAP